MHFALLGLAIFAAYSAMPAKGPDPAGKTIVVSAAKIEQMAAIFSRTWSRPPGPDELKALIDDYIAEEVMVREALALGLDQDDTVIRRRLRQKMEFATDTQAAQAAPGDAELQAFFAARAADYEIDPKIGFEQIFINPQSRGEGLDGDIAAMLATLKATPETDPSVLGDPSMLPADLPPTGLGRIEGDFGAGFAQAIARLPAGVWAGPIASVYGLHLVRVSERQAGRTPPLDEVRDAVLRDWSAEERTRRMKAQLESLLSRYSVTVETVPAVPK